MELRINDYVRTKNFGIKKILDIGGFLGMKQYLINEDGTYVIDNSIIKSSPNIMDLIEVGDYVNGECVYSRCETKLWLDGDTGEILIIDGEPDEPIKSIVTKEQFESMEYKIGG